MTDTLNGSGPGRILVVDDTGANLQLLTSILSEQGYTVYPASDGELALEFLRRTLPDLILLDIQMPGIDGYEVCRRLKSDEKARDVPVIFISALENERDKVQGFRVGGVDYITKPFQSEEVVARIKTHLRIRELTVRLEHEVDKRTEELATANLRLQQELAERRRAEEALLRSNRELRAISDCNQVLVRAEEEQSLLNEICRIICVKAGYRLVWVGSVEHDEAKSVRPVAWAGHESGYLDRTAITWADTPQGQGPTGTAVRSGRATCIQDFTADPKAAPWRDKALARGYRSSIALPLKDGSGSVFGVLNIYATEPDFFTVDEIRLLSELAGDLAFGIEVLRARKSQVQAEQESALRGFALNSVHEAAFLIDSEARLLYVNDEACRMLRYSREELLAATVADLDPDFPEDRWPEHWRNLQDKKSLTFEGRHRTRDGTDLPVEINANYFEYQGAPYNLALVRDITERRQAERERLDHLRYFEAMDRINRVIHSAADLDDLMRRVLDETLAVFGCDRAYLLSPCDPESAVWTVPMERTRPEFPGILELGIEMPMTEGVAATFRVLLASDHPVTFGPDGDYPLVQEVAERFGFHCFMAAALSPKTGKPWQFGIHQCSGPRTWTPHEIRIFGEIARRIGDGLTGLLAYRELAKSEEDLRQLNESLEERVKSRTLELARSHDELQQAYDDLKTAQSRILQQEKMASIGQLAAGVAHEINNPMGFILSNLNTLGKYTGRLLEYQNAQQAAFQELAGKSEPVRAKVEELKTLAESLKIKAVTADIEDLVAESVEGGERVKEIVLNLKSFARLDEEELKSADLNQCLESTLNIVWNELKYKCTVNKEYGDIPLIKCNPGQLNQVFMNLLVNAAQAIESQGEVRIATRLDNGFVEVLIEDTGCGIPADKLSRIFEPFFTTKEVGRGTGLGLSIAYDIVKKHSGEIEVASEVGKGTTFIVRLPIRAKEDFPTHQSEGS